MNRPEKEDFYIHDSDIYLTTFDVEGYTKALEKYIDQLEKALDKACGMLEVFNKNDWKEWCMKDEENNRK